MVRYSLRLPDDLHQRIKDVAADETRSMNDQMIVMLREGIAIREKRNVATNVAKPGEQGGSKASG